MLPKKCGLYIKTAENARKREGLPSLFYLHGGVKIKVMGRAGRKKSAGRQAFEHFAEILRKRTKPDENFLQEGGFIQYDICGRTGVCAVSLCVAGFAGPFLTRWRVYEYEYDPYCDQAFGRPGHVPVRHGGHG